MIRHHHRTCLIVAIICAATVVRGQENPLAYDVQTDVVLRELRREFCWFHPRAAALPGFGRDGQPAVIVTIQKHLSADDHYSGLYFLRTDDLGATWTGPVEIPELAWRMDAEGATISVADVTPGWHARTGRLLAIGTKVRYSPQGVQLLDQPRSHECAYATFDPKTGRWSPWKMLVMPETEAKFFLVAPGCVQWLTKGDGTLLLPIYYRGPAGSDYAATVVQCRFDGETLTYLRHGDEMTLAGGRGLVEPSLAYFGETFYLTLRNDARGYVATSLDGLHFGLRKPWTFDDGGELGSYNTQAHWLVHSAGLFLSYTRRGADNDQIPRHRAPLFVAQVDPQRLHVLRATEKVLIPERGVMLGNFGAAAITPDESWVTDAEFLVGDQPHPRGADGSVFVARVRWSRPNTRVPSAASPLTIVTLGDSITKGVRSGVGERETFAALVQQRLREAGLAVEVANVGIGGERTDQALLRLDRDVLPRKPRIVTIMYGTNDSYVDKGRTDVRIPLADYRANLVRLVDRLRDAGVAPVLMTEPRWGDAASLNGADEHPNLRLEKYVAVCREVARDKGVPLVDHFQIWSDAARQGTDIGQWTTDQCHPNPEGHRLLAEALLPALLRILGVP